MMKKKLMGFLICIELCVIIFFVIKIYSQKAYVLGQTTVSINPIKKEDLIFPEAELKDFYEPKPNSIQESTEDWLEKKAHYSINSDSLNERFDYSVEKSKSTFRIITLGDSYTFGLTVDTSKNYPETLEDILNANLFCPSIKKFEVINFGVAGYDIAYAVERFKKRGEKYNPDLLLWFLKQDDFTNINELMLKKAEKYKKKLSDDNQIEAFRENGDFFPYWKFARADVYNQIGIDEVRTYQSRAIKKISMYHKSTILIFTEKNLINEKEKNIITDFLNITAHSYFYDEITNTFADNSLRQKDGHPNEAGYAVMAKELFEVLKDKKIIPCD